MLRKLKGFTLIELLIVIAIIAILTVAFLPQIRGAQGKGRDAARKAAVDQIMTAIESLGSIPVSTGVCLEFNSGAGLTIKPALTNIPQSQSAGGVILCGGGYFYKTFKLDGNATAGNDTAANYVIVTQLESNGNVYKADPDIVPTNTTDTVVISGVFSTRDVSRALVDSSLNTAVRKFYAVVN